MTKVIVIGAIFSLLWTGYAMPEESLVPVQTILLEARGESLEGQIAVGEVIRNRAFKASRTFEATCLWPKQFSCWNEPLIANKALSMIGGNTFQIASKAWVMSEGSNLTSGATHYHTIEVSPYWAVGHKPCVVIGNHKFYNDVR